MARMISGHYSGSPNPLAVYINPLYSSVIVKLYLLFPGVGWYGLILLLFLFISLLISVHLVKSVSNQNKFIFLIGMLFILPFYFQAIVSVQYTFISGIMAFNGFLLLIENKNNKFIYTASGIFLVVLAFMIRQNVIFYVFFVSSPLLFLNFISSSKKYKKQIILGLIIIFVSCFFAKTYADKALTQTDEWKKYMEWSHVQAYYHEYNVVEYSKNKKVYDEIGWSENDFNIFNYWFYVDENKFTTEDLTKIISYSNKNNISFEGLIYTLRFFSSQFYFHGSPFLILISFISIFYPYFSNNKKNFLGFLLTAGTVFALLLYFSFMGRVVPVRFIYPLFMITGICMFILFCKDSTTIKMKGKFLFTMFFVTFALAQFFSLAVSARLNDMKISNFNKILERIPRNSLVFNWDSSIPVHWISVYDSFERFEEYDIAGTGWPQRSPYDKALFAKHNVNNLYIDMIDNPNIYLIATPKYLELLKIYMVENHNIRIEIEKIEDFSTHDIEPRYGFGAYLVRIRKG